MTPTLEELKTMDSTVERIAKRKRRPVIATEGKGVTYIHRASEASPFSVIRRSEFGMWLVWEPGKSGTDKHFFSDRAAAFRAAHEFVSASQIAPVLERKPKSSAMLSAIQEG